MILNLHDSIFPMYLQLSKDSKMNNKMVTAFKTIELFFFTGVGEKEKNYYYLQIFNTLKRLQINVGEDVWKRQPTLSTMSYFV